MDPITALALSETIQGVSTAVRSLTEDKPPTETSGFDTVLRGMLEPDEANSINEEELFSALISQRLGVHAGEEAAQAYQKKLEERKAALTRADGYIPVEDAANQALGSLVTDGTITADIGAQVKNESFTAAQLDDNKNELFDGRGSANDPTIAVMSMEAALIMAQQAIERIESGEEPVINTTENNSATASEDSTGSEKIIADGNTIDGAGGFLLKPAAEHTNKMVILLPAAMAEQVMELVLKDEDGKVIERGVSSGYANPDQNGEREHFRFTKAGSEYPKNITIEVTLADGSVKEYSIADPGSRND